MTDHKPVQMCMCYCRTFSELTELAREHGWKSAAEIGSATGCGTGCGLCRPYLARMLKTGETEFDVMRDADW